MKWGNIVGEFIGSYVYSFLIALAILLVLMGPYLGIIQDSCSSLIGAEEQALCVYKIAPESSIRTIQAIVFFGFLSMALGYYLLGKDNLTWGLIIFFGGMHLIPFVNRYSWLFALGYLVYVYQ